jgi:hypothetical protein
MTSAAAAPVAPDVAARIREDAPPLSGADSLDAPLPTLPPDTGETG